MNLHFKKPQKLKPSSKFFVRAKPLESGRGFHAQFSAPGLVPELVGGDNRPQVFPTEDAALLAAYQAQEAVLNARLQLRMRFEKVQKMSAVELSAALDEADLTPTELGWICQTDRVMAWLDGTYDIPHMVRVIVGLCKEPENVDRAESITGASVIERTRQ
ncbi:MAG: hypothetical protein J0I99_00455 [Devosia sp.]|uniref:hypothetical protein n=1 Tax=Devosia sp. TaxID=1871048 RepID=UPI001AD05DD3|nr:hypothetical protein [Devosia sp.]MBN9310834.1 hypothetical protein [Devosia sp.]MBN9314187.1 hypothetical protein [Devosia sp.]